MSIELEAVFEDGVFRPLQPVQLMHRQRVIVTIPDDAQENGDLTLENQSPLIVPEASIDEEERPWRGVFSTNHQGEEIFTQPVHEQIENLPVWQPRVIVDPRWLEADDD